MTTETDTGPVGATHVPVMVAEVAEWLRPRPGARLVDATVGLGGHAAALVAAVPDARLLGVDRDPAALACAAERLRDAGERVALRRARYGELPEVLADLGWDGADAILLDLGVSSLQLDDAARGFSFRFDGPLDMRMDPDASLDAAEIVNRWPERISPASSSSTVRSDARGRWLVPSCVPGRSPRREPSPGSLAAFSAAAGPESTPRRARSRASASR